MSSKNVRPYPFSPPHGIYPHPMFGWLRKHEPVSRVVLPFGGQAWLAVRHADVKTVLSDARFSRAAAVGPKVPRQAPEPPWIRTITDYDRPEHGRLRRLVAHEFSYQRVESLRPFVRQVADELIESISARNGLVDLIQSFVLPFSFTVIGRILGVPHQELSEFRKVADALVIIQKSSSQEYCEMIANLDAYVAKLVGKRRQHQSCDLVAALVANCDMDHLLTETELISLIATILTAGYQTTANHIANDVFLLLSDRKLWQLLCSSAALTRHAVNEMLRVVPLNDGAGFPRVALQDVQLSGVTVRTGETTFVSTNSANHDADVFDSPEHVNLNRSSNPHVAFGYGVHRCLGRHLAMLEIQEGIGALVRSVPDLSLAISAQRVRWKRDSLIRGPVELPVRWPLGPPGVGVCNRTTLCY